MYIIHHDHCMDGIMSAYVAYNSLLNDSLKVMPAQYNNKYVDKISPHEEVMYVDFCPSKDDLDFLLNVNLNKVMVIDHHQTSLPTLELFKDHPNLKYIHDNSKSGALLTMEYFQTEDGITYTQSIIKLVNYVSDRDLWKFKLHKSREIMEGILSKVDLNKYKSIDNLFNHRNEIDFDELEEIGKQILKFKEKIIESNIDKNKEVTMFGVKLLMKNTVNFISDTGNKICTKYGTPSLTYFIDQNLNVIFSLRSLDNMVDVSKIATKMGGGGHRNACGFTGNLKTLDDIVKGVYSEEA